ncbi:polyphosphate kinase 1 [bacterium]|nr:MAG: polyphosphate kinase 1 [bacterium]
MSGRSFSPDEPSFDPQKYTIPIDKQGLKEPQAEPMILDPIDNPNLPEEEYKPSELFNNYELSWLKFNERVLNEAWDARNPLLERVRFIAIVCSNLDEFFQKRVGGLKRQLYAGVQKLSVDGLTPRQQLRAIRQEVKKMISSYRECFLDVLIPEMEKQNIFFKKYLDLEPAQKQVIDEYFNRQLFPILTPLAVDNSRPFPFISNKSRSFAVELIDPNNPEETVFARIKVPSNRPRWLQAERTADSITLVSIDDVIKENVDRLFPGMEVLSANIFRVTRSADVERNEEEAEDLLVLIEDELRERRFAEVVRLEIDADTPHHIKELLIQNMRVSWADVFEMNGPIGLADSTQIADLDDYDSLKFKPWVPTLHPVFRHELDEDAPDIFSLIRKGDFMVHHPYQSFATSVQHFIEVAAADPNVLAIKQTLYRTSKDSPLMHALIKAADSGKQVAVLVELKARFDEERNIEWAHKLEKAGVHVAYGLPGLKIHTKLTYVVREEEGELRRYLHIGTGNYHPKTAQLYEDFGLFTTDETLAADVSSLFNFLTGYAPEQQYKKLIVAPRYMRKTFTSLIENEIEEAKAGRPARIIAKMNSLEDTAIIEQLYEASKAGVQIDVIVRGVCRLKAQVPGLSENIRIHSVIGRFLEHSRIYYFYNKGQDSYYIGSADWMHRNLDARVEAISPIEHPNLKQYLQFVLNVYLRDNCQRWEMNADGLYTKPPIADGETEIKSHQIFMNHAHYAMDPIAVAYSL